MNEIALILLLLTANGMPVLLKLALGEHLDYPLDGHRRFIDGRPVFGDTKTIRGIFASLAATSLVAVGIGIPATTGLIVSVSAMLGDLLSSFIKRRLGIPSSKPIAGLDQIPESLLPLLAIRSQFELSWSNVLLLMIGFFILELFFSRLLVMTRRMSDD
jgi:CDP-2,3-bis-(O-geranylgeranyl)-sn-glycerol synthase